MTNPYTAENEIYSVLPGGIRVKGLVFTHKIYLIVLFYFIFHADNRVLFLVQATARNGTVTLRFFFFCSEFCHTLIPDCFSLLYPYICF